MTKRSQSRSAGAGRHIMRAGSPARLGARIQGENANFAVFSDNATKIEICLFDADGKNETARLALPERTGAIWHGAVDGLQAGQLYGLRAHGPYQPEQGHRFNPNKLLLDPYATSVSGAFGAHELTLGYKSGAPGEDVSFSTSDSAKAMPKCVLLPNAPAIDPGERPDVSWEETVIYEAHPKGLTRLWPGLRDEVRGTYDAIGSEPVLEHLTTLGVTAIELMPVHMQRGESWLAIKGLTNYWGYNTIGFFAPEPRYFGPAGAAGFRDMVRKVHGAGIEVILDVVYNHTAEGNHLGPTLCFRGLDNASYYRLQRGAPRFYVNDTGCGNTLNVAHPQVLRLVLDSLRWWVETMGVDGFRFDLATTLGREEHGFDPNGGFFDALRQDPVLAGVKLIAEPWDVGPGGYQLGNFPPGFAEWNDAYRDTVRRFWRGDAHSAQEFAERLLGSAGTFDRGGRPSWSSINHAACHDGFTLADVVSYRGKRNGINGEHNRDGHHENFSDNCGIEGPTDDSAILDLRTLRQRNLLASVFLSQGTPMILSGDEIGSSQNGNNNAYCQDSEISWIDWDACDENLLAFTKHLTAFRKAHHCLRQGRFLHGQRRQATAPPDIEWRGFDGEGVAWQDPRLDRFCLILRDSAEAPDYAANGDVVFLAVNGSDQECELTFPAPPSAKNWRKALDTATPGQGHLPVAPGRKQPILAHSISAFDILVEP